MRERAVIHVGGPQGSGKTVFVEAVVGAGKGSVLMLTARCVRDAARRRACESSPRTHPELQRYLRAGADAAALFVFPAQDVAELAFYETELMLNYSESVIVEGDNPLAFADLEVFVAPVPSPGESLYIRQHRNVAAAQRAKMDAWENQLSRPDGMAMWIDDMIGRQAGDFVRRSPLLVEDVRTRMLTGIAAIRTSPPPQPVEYWAVSDRFRGIERAALVVVNIRDETDRVAAELLVADVRRLRKDDDLFRDILGWRGHRTPITAVVANIADPSDSGRQKALTRVRRTLRMPR
jgi:hypothetical protein